MTIPDTTSQVPAPPRAPRAAKLLATALGLGYFPIASGTWGSLGGVALYLIVEWSVPRLGALRGESWAPGSPSFLAAFLAVNVVVALAGVWAAGAMARHWKMSDPGPVVIDEVSGQLITYIALAPLGWKHLLAGFLLFRAFDIWKPFPARQAESLPGGWGIMADDWVAGLYSALLLWLARLAGL